MVIKAEVVPPGLPIQRILSGTIVSVKFWVEGVPTSLPAVIVNA